VNLKDTCGGDKGGFIAGQAFRFSGFVSQEGSLSASRAEDEHIAIVTYWRSFEEHERSHADAAFRAKFAAVAEMCSDSKELGHDLLWQGEPGA
jgi:heme-degrading monooxygenase HmoA